VTAVFEQGPLVVFLAALFRVGGMFITGPIWHHVSIPLPVKTGVALMITLAAWPVVGGSTPPATPTLAALVVLVVKELVVGALIGLTARLLFAGVEYAGQMIGISIGLSMADVMDPITNAHVSAVSRIYELFALAIFFAADVHHLLIRAVVGSFSHVPLGVGAIGPGTLAQLLGFGGRLFVVGIQIAAPIMAVLLLAELAMGLLVRTVPQMNISVVGFPLKIGLGILLMVVTLPFLVEILIGSFHRLDLDLGRVIGGL
jgi:flagellar biosynthetic protein FliR